MKTTSKAFNLLFCAAWMGLMLGCSADSTVGTVVGTVTFDGEPLKTGIIRFDPTDSRTATADAVIKEGKFTAKVPPGDKRVAITSPKVVGKKKMYDTPDSPVIDLTDEMVPKRYNANSELKLTVKAGNQDPEPTFDLKSK
jgi:hypothetical protein